MKTRMDKCIKQFMSYQQQLADGFAYAIKVGTHLQNFKQGRIKKLVPQSTFFMLLLLTLSVSCTKDDDPVPLSNEAIITDFKINDVKGTVTEKSIEITLPNGTDPTGLLANVTISENASIAPDPQTNVDYSSPKEFTVTAEDGITKTTYTVTVTIEPDSEANLISFEINGVQGTITDKSIEISLPNGADPTSLSAAVIIPDNATIDPDPQTDSDYSSPKAFTVTAEDGVTKKTYTVTVSIAPVTPTAQNPYPEGVFILRSLGSCLQTFMINWTTLVGS